VLLAAFGIDFAHLGITGLTYPADLAPLICLAWMVLGVGLLGYFMLPDRPRIAKPGGSSPSRRQPSASTSEFPVDDGWSRNSASSKHSDVAERRRV
jgi:hypothetical protein